MKHHQEWSLYPHGWYYKKKSARMEQWSDIKLDWLATVLSNDRESILRKRTPCLLPRARSAWHFREQLPRIWRSTRWMWSVRSLRVQTRHPFICTYRVVSRYEARVMKSFWANTIPECP